MAHVRLLGKQEHALLPDTHWTSGNSPLVEFMLCANLVPMSCQGIVSCRGRRGGFLHGGDGGTSPRVWYATPPLPALRAHLVAKGQQLLAIHMVAPKAPKFFFSFPLPILSALHPNTILEPNLDFNAHPNPQPTPNPTPKPYP